MRLSTNKAHFFSACLLLLTGLEGLIWLGLFLPGASDSTFANIEVAGFLVFWAALAIALTIIGTFTLLGRSSAIALIERVKWLFDTRNNWSRVTVPALLAAYVLAATGVLLLWGANNPLLLQFAEPLGRWFFLAALQAILVRFFVAEKATDKDYRKLASLILATIALLWLVILSTRIGLEPDNRYWNVAGVPMLINRKLAMNLLLALFGIFLYGLLTRKPAKNPRRREILLDLLACLILWAGAAWFWHQAPFSNSFFAEGVFPPNQDYYPYSDAALTDLGGQYMLIGKGLEYPYFTEKPLYALFLGLLHKFVGQNYLTVTSWQMICFAVFPVLLYLLGKQIHDRLFGLAIALFSVAKEYNAIFATFKISVSNSRLYLSEFPTMILLALLALMLVSWFKRMGSKNPWPLLAGGVLGLAVMVRTNPLFLIPVILLFALWVYRRDLKHYWGSALLFLCGILLVIGPWLAYTRIRYGIDPITYKINAVIQTRFLQQEQQAAPTGFEQDILRRVNERPVIPSESTTGESSSQSSQQGVVEFTLGHFFNNEIKALFTLPFVIYPMELTPVLDLPYWEEPVIWHGELPLSTILAFALNLTLIGLGIAASWKYNRAAGLVPLVLNIGYYASNALGRTSGSRYLLPVDWTLYFYFLLALTLLYERGAHLRSTLPEEQQLLLNQQQARKRRPMPLIGYAGLLLLLGSSIPLINLSFPDLYTNQKQDEIKAALYASPLYSTQPSLAELSDQLLEKDAALLFKGRMLYPRYRDFVLNGKEGLILTVLRPELTEVFFSFDTDDLTYLEAGKEIIVLGCQRDGFVEAFTAYLPEQGLTLRSNIADFNSSCP